MKQGVVDPLVPYPSVGKENDGMDLVTGRSENALCMQGSSSLFPAHVHIGSEENGSKSTHLVSSFLGRAWSVISMFCCGVAGESSRSRSRGTSGCSGT